MTITLCNSHPFTFYLPFHTSLRADQCPIHVPSTCTLGLDPCARHSLFGRTDPYYIDNFYSSCGLKRLAATLASPLLCNCTVLPVPLSTGPYLDNSSLHYTSSDTASSEIFDIAPFPPILFVGDDLEHVLYGGLTILWVYFVVCLNVWSHSISYVRSHPHPTRRSRV